MNKEQLEQALTNYLNGTASAEDKAMIDHWYARYDTHAPYTEALSATEREVLRRKMLEQIRHNTGMAYTQQQPAARVIKRRAWVKWAAAAAMIAGIMVITWRWYMLSNMHQQMNLVVNQTKHLLRQQLPDQSVVWLSPGASLRYPAQFQQASRNVSMSGDCFFEVTKNPDRPFIIESNQLVTKVWGTSFRVWDGKEGGAARVTVVSGKVSVSRRQDEGAASGARLAKDEVILLPKQEVVYSSHTQSLQRDTLADMKAVQKWTHTGTMAVEDAPFTTIIAQLEQRFGVQIQLADSALYQARMTADLSGLNLAEAMEVLQVSMQIQYSIQDNRIIIFPPKK